MKKNTENMLLVEKKDFIAFLTIHYPEKRNALTPKLLMDLHITLETFSKNDDIRCVVIKGSGDKAFSSGYDIAAIPVDPMPDARQETPDILLQALESIKIKYDQSDHNAYDPYSPAENYRKGGETVYRGGNGSRCCSSGPQTEG